MLHVRCAGGSRSASGVAVALTLFCPTSIKACALRITKLQPSGLAWNPATYPGRTVQGSAFVEVGLAPIVESGAGSKIKQAGGTTFAVLHQDFDQLHGFDVTIKFCGMPALMAPLFLDGLYDVVESDVLIHGAALRDGVANPCTDAPLAIEVWSKNIGDPCPDGTIAAYPWIHWVLPLTDGWILSSNLTFNLGALEVEIKGRAVANPWWYPSFPGVPFGSYVSDFPSGPPPTLLPPGVTADEWTIGDWQQIRASGPLGWRGVAALPAPLDDCALLPDPSVPPVSPCEGGTFRFADGTVFAGHPFVGDPSFVFDPYVDPTLLLPSVVGGGTLTPWQVDSGTVIQPPSSTNPDINASAGLVPFVPVNCCDQDGRTMSIVGDITEWLAVGDGTFRAQLPVATLIWSRFLQPNVIAEFAGYVIYEPGVGFTFGAVSAVFNQAGEAFATAVGTQEYAAPEATLPTRYNVTLVWLTGPVGDPLFALLVAAGTANATFQFTGGGNAVLNYGAYPPPVPEATFVGGILTGTFDAITGGGTPVTITDWVAECGPWNPSGSPEFPYVRYVP